jgi:hypothetical protein
MITPEPITEKQAAAGTKPGDIEIDLRTGGKGVTMILVAEDDTWFHCKNRYGVKYGFRKAQWWEKRRVVLE